MPAALRLPARSGAGAVPGAGVTTVRPLPQDPEWLWDFFMTHDGGFPLGHGKGPRTLPLGTVAELDTSSGTLRVQAGVR